MPDFSLDTLNVESDEPLFPSNDLLTFELPDPETGDRKRFVCIDHPLLPDDRVNNLRSAPRAYLVATLAGNVADGKDRKEVTELTHRLFDESMVDVDQIMELIDYITEQRDAAKKRRAKEKLRRPTGAPSLSPPS